MYCQRVDPIYRILALLRWRIHFKSVSLDMCGNFSTQLDIFSQIIWSVGHKDVVQFYLKSRRDTRRRSRDEVADLAIAQASRRVILA